MMNQFLFDAVTIIGGILFSVWGITWPSKKYRKISWYFFWPAIICFSIAVINSYYRNSPISQSDNSKISQLKDSMSLASKIEQKDSSSKNNSMYFKSEISKKIIPYVFIDWVEFSFRTDVPLNIRVEYINSSVMPAYNFVHIAGLKKDTVTTKDSLKLIEAIKEKNLGLTLAPKTSMAGSYDFFKVSASDSANFSHQIKEYIVLGAFSYSDASQKLHLTMYCFVVHPNSTLFHLYQRYNHSY